MWGTFTREDLTASERPGVGAAPQDWRVELSERIENFRKRRARLQPDADSTLNLELDFEDSHESQGDRSLDDALGTPQHRDTGFDLEFGGSAVTRGQDGPSSETHSLEAPGDETVQFDAAPAGAEEMSLGEPFANEPPLEIMVGSPLETLPEEEGEEDGILLAPLGRRFLAGLTDALVLILGAAVFGTVFWRVCGRISLGPFNLAILGLVAVILIFAYFGLFTAIAAATPGLLWMGCEIRNLRGSPPTVRESFWRALGVLVSLSALMVGFLWALVDSDSLTWHDRMSRTVITEASDAAALPRLEAES